MLWIIKFVFFSLCVACDFILFYFIEYIGMEDAKDSTHKIHVAVARLCET